jgi:uncharacterized protein YqgV (UPF0045/DUF77 family)
MRILIPCVLLLAVGCKEKPSEPIQTNDVDIAAVVARAEDDAKRVHLPNRLEEAGTNVRKLAEVYLEAVRLGHVAVRDQADARLGTILLPRAEAATWKGTLRRLKKKAPPGSQTWQRLDAIERELLKNDPH